uniref:Uncharacterized protein n=1 Tax=Odontella aurita TaxID=265563 RepID=A0A7S4IH93_9STRA|mmetsp:Transcript_25156/g.73807  ORF Transcript_25156/g.73807 Transcript_25156/m.73807 type:complete len:450 (+) Transcript_25156:406-1755(+)
MVSRHRHGRRHRGVGSSRHGVPSNVQHAQGQGQGQHAHTHAPSSSPHAASELARAAMTMEGEMAILRPGQNSSDLRSGVPLPGGAVPLPGSPGLKKFDKSALIGPGDDTNSTRRGPPIRRPQLASGGRKLRSDLLHKLGIDEAASKGKKTEAELRQRSRATADRSLLADMPSRMTPLKYDPIWEEELDCMVSTAAGETDHDDAMGMGMNMGMNMGMSMGSLDHLGGASFGTFGNMEAVVADAREVRSAPGSRASSPPKGRDDASASSGQSWQENLASLFSSLGGGGGGGGGGKSKHGDNGGGSAKPSPPQSEPGGDGIDDDEASVHSVDSQPQTAMETAQASLKHSLLPPQLGPGRRRKLTFFDDVRVVPIPMRTEYSDRVRERLWSNRMELHENAQRNAVEFASEGWDWRTVTEDEGMYRCAVSGELIHPVHCQTPYHDDNGAMDYGS